MSVAFVHWMKGFDNNDLIDLRIDWINRKSNYNKRVEEDKIKDGEREKTICTKKCLTDFFQMLSWKHLITFVFLFFCIFFATSKMSSVYL